MRTDIPVITMYSLIVLGQKGVNKQHSFVAIHHPATYVKTCA
jgi:glucose-6-phosphate isomerase